MNKLMLAYALDFTSFLIQNLQEKDILNIKEIILFGSAARGKAGSDSDVDIFINAFKKGSLESKVKGIVNGFYDSRMFRYWKLLSVENPITCITGKLDDWKDLKPSIISDGIVLYSKYSGLLKGRTFAIMYWDKVRPESKRVLLSKKIYGYNYKGKRYEGILKEAGIQKLGSNCILVPLDAVQKVSKIFKELGITMKTIYVSRFQ